MRLPKDDLEKQKMLSMIAEDFELNKEYSEDEVNNTIKRFDVEDYVLVRRELVNFYYLAKDSYKGIYTLITKKLTEEQLERIGKTQNKIQDMD